MSDTGCSETQTNRLILISKMSNLTMSNRGWSETPSDVLTLISKRIYTVRDFLSFRSVCKSWRSSSYSLNFLVPSPQLLTPQCSDTSSDKQEKEGEPYFLGFTRGGILNERLFKCIGSKQNWIVTADIKARIRIVNPFSNVHFVLPPQTAWNFKHQVSKVVLSSTPNTQNCIAVALCEDRLLCTAKPGDRSWTIIKSNIDDVVFLKGGIYAITWGGKVSVFDTNCQFVREIYTQPLPDTVPSIVEDEKPDVDDEKLEHYLVEHYEELLMVSRKYQSDYSFKVYRLDYAEAIWKHVKRVRLHWLFMGFHTSVMMPASDPSDFLRESVYFAQIEQERGVLIKRYDIKTKTVECFATDHVFRLQVSFSSLSFSTINKELQ